MGFPTKWLPSAALGVCLFPLLVTAWVPEPKAGTTSQTLVSEEVWIPQAGVYPPGLYFDRWDEEDGTLHAISFEVRSRHRLFHGIETLDEHDRWNAFGADPGAVCDCYDISACDGTPDGSWVKSRLELLVGELMVTVGAATDVFPLSVIGCRGPYDGTTDHDGPSGTHRWLTSGCVYGSDGRLTDPEILAEVTGPGFESVHVKFHYGATGRFDCPENGAENFNVDSSYNHYGRAAVTLTYWYTE